MNLRHLQAFEDADLERSFERYCIEKFVQRWLRTNGVDTVGDLLALDEIEIVEFLANASNKVRERVLALYTPLQKNKQKIMDKGAAPRLTSDQSVTSSPSARPQAEVQAPVVLDSTADHHATREIQVSDAGPANFESSETGADAHSSAEDLSEQQASSRTTEPDPPPIVLGPVLRRETFGKVPGQALQKLPFTEDGLRRHLLIAGATGSGKTVAARYIIEQAAIQGVPSIVVDAQGDISSLVLQCADSNIDSLFTAAAALKKTTPGSREDRDLKRKIGKHVKALGRYDSPVSRLYFEGCLPRIFSPGQPALALPLSLPPYLDVLAAWSDESLDDFLRSELQDLLSDEVRNFVRKLFPRSRHDLQQDYEELLIKLFQHAHDEDKVLEGSHGISNLKDLVDRAPEVEPELCHHLGEKKYEELRKAVFRLGFSQEEKWLQGTPLDLPRLLERTPDGRTPINIINVQELRNYEDKKRVLRHLIAAVYKFGVGHPKESGKPSLILYIDEIGTGYGERTVGKQERDAPYRVYPVLNQLVRQARKYGVSVVLASQAYTDFSPDIRRQLGTKIIGRVDDRSEQGRVATSVGDDLLDGGEDPGEIVARELPTLGPPRLLCIGVRGAASTYEQLKCCTLDVVLSAREVQRWRSNYEDEANHLVAEGRRLLSEKSLPQAVVVLEEAVSRAQFLPSLGSSAAGLFARSLVAQGRIEEANDLLEQVLSDEVSEDWVIAGHEIARAFLNQGEVDSYSSALTRCVNLARNANTDSATLERLRVELASCKLFESHDVEAAAAILQEISANPSKKASIFAKAWQQVLGLFREWGGVWGFFGPEALPAHLVVRGETPLSIRITRLSRDIESTDDPTPYTSELAARPGILRLSELRAEGESGERRDYSLQEFKAAHTLQHDLIQRALEQRRAGSIEEAIAALEQFYKEVELVALDEQTQREISSFDDDPEIRRVRMDSWLDSLSWRSFEFEVANLLVQMGYEAFVTRASGDGGVDVRARRNDERVVVQCKHWKGQKVGLESIQALAGARDAEGATQAIFVTSSWLEPGAHKWARRVGMEVIDRRDLVRLFEEYCDPNLAAELEPNVEVAELLIGVPFDSGVSEPTNQLQVPFLDKKDLLILEHVREMGEIRNRDVQELLGLSRPGAGGRLRKLVRRGLLEMHGTKAVAFYTSLDEV